LSSSTAISVSNLRKTYAEGLFFRKRQEALKGVSFEVQRGEIFGLLGGNGAGKTTFIKILLGIIRRSGGEAQVLDFPAGDSRARARIGYLPENLRVPRHLTGYTALEYYGNLSGLSTRVIKERRGALLEKVGIAARAKDPVRTYSKGMLQRLGLAQAMLHDPDLFIFDEPTDGLDPLARSQVRGFLTDLKRQGKTIFLNSHILQEVQLVCDRVAILDKGVLKRVGSVQELTAGHHTAPATNGNPTAQADIQLHLAGTAAAIREALGGWEVTKWQSLSELEHQVDIRSANQEYVDQLIDRLRASRISLLGLTRHRATLEDAYLGIVAEVK
jgi:ABC-2 type transport system ATP-binding protein